MTEHNNKTSIGIIIAILITLSTSFIQLSCNSAKEDLFLTDIGVCTSLSNAEMLSQHGYTFIEESVGNFLVPSESEEEFDRILEQVQESALPVPVCNSFIPGSLKSVGPEAVHHEILEYMETAFRRAKKAGVEYIVYGSGASRNIPDGFQREQAQMQFIKLCKAMATIAAKYDVVVLLEPLTSKMCNFINSVPEGAEIVEEVNHPNLRLMADIYHMLMDDEGPESFLQYGHLIKHIHIAEKEGRAAPGTHNEDFRPYFDALKKVGYQGRISIEIFDWDEIESEAASAIKAIKDQI